MLDNNKKQQSLRDERKFAPLVDTAGPAESAERIIKNDDVDYAARTRDQYAYKGSLINLL